MKTDSGSAFFIYCLKSFWKLFVLCEVLQIIHRLSFCVYEVKLSVFAVTVGNGGGHLSVIFLGTVTNRSLASGCKL